MGEVLSLANWFFQLGVIEGVYSRNAGACGVAPGLGCGFWGTAHVWYISQVAVGEPDSTIGASFDWRQWRGGQRQAGRNPGEQPRGSHRHPAGAAFLQKPFKPQVLIQKV